MKAGSVCFLLGVVSFMQLSEIPPIYFYGFLPVCLCFAGRYRFMQCISWYLFGFSWTFFCAQAVLNKQLPPDLEGRKLFLTSKIVSLPVLRQDMSRITVLPLQVQDEQGRPVNLQGKIQLNWYRNAPSLSAGQIWRLQVKLKRPYGFMNPGGFDYEAWLFQRRIMATGYVLNHPENDLIKESEGQYIHRLRGYLAGRIGSVFPESANAAFLATLAVGERSSLSAGQWRVLTATGTNHLMAISGLHIGFIAALSFWLARLIWPLFGNAALLIAAPRMAIFVSISSAACYAALAGFAVPTQRALIMLLVFLGLKLFHRQTSGSQIIALAALLVVFIDPFAVLSAGFWLSFAALIVIVSGMNSRYRCDGLWWRWGRVQYLVAVGLMPLLILWFGQVPLLSMVANTLAVPWVSILTVPLTLTGSGLLLIYEPVGVFVLHIALLTLDIVWVLLEFIAGLEVNTLSFHPASWWGICLALVGSTILLLPAGLCGRFLGLFCFLPLFFPQSDRLAEEELRFTLLDVGQGLAALIQTRDHVLLYDTGAKYSPSFNAGSAVITPYLQQLGLSELDKLIVSHGDNDHIGGLQSVLDAISVSSIQSSVPLADKGLISRFCDNSQAWNWNGIAFRMLHPGPDTKLSGNNASCVLRIRLHDTTILLTGDIEGRAEKLLLKRYPEELKTSILIAPHHGSGTSSSPLFLDATMPEIVLFPVGYRNRFGFPKQDIMDRYRERGVRMLDTASSGAIEFRVNKAGFTYSEYRRVKRRFWHTVTINN